MLKQLLFFLMGVALAKLQGQFAPAAGRPGSTAIKADSNCFQSWAVSCRIERGLKQINVPDSGYASVGNPENALGPLGGGLVSLGDGGIAILSFDPPIANGPGFDFAVFENAFNDSFLELAHVEVSSDGVHWVRFPNESLTQYQLQTHAFGFTRPENLHNLAGKYRTPFGTPFDLEELKDSIILDLDWIPFVRLIDVIGSIDSAWGSRDSKGRLINDPWPSLFPSSGFDLDAIGVMHNSLSASINFISPSCYFDCESVCLRQCPPESGTLFSGYGQAIIHKLNNNTEWELPKLASGFYVFRTQSGMSLAFIMP